MEINESLNNFQFRDNNGVAEYRKSGADTWVPFLSGGISFGDICTYTQTDKSVPREISVEAGKRYLFIISDAWSNTTWVPVLKSGGNVINELPNINTTRGSAATIKYKVLEIETTSNKLIFTDYYAGGNQYTDNNDGFIAFYFKE